MNLHRICKQIIVDLYQGPQETTNGSQLGLTPILLKDSLIL